MTPTVYLLPGRDSNPLNLKVKRLKRSQSVSRQKRLTALL